MRFRKYILYAISVIGILFPFVSFAASGTIDPSNTGNHFSRLCKNTDCSIYTKVNWKPSHSGWGATVTDSAITGYIWSESLGNINLSPHTSGVQNTTSGVLSGYAWGDNAGWVNFSPTHGGVTIDTTTGNFSGYAWVQNGGWMLFDCSKTDACVTTDWTSGGTTTGGGGITCSLSSFTASSTSIYPGDSSTLTWVTNSCAYSTITKLDTSGSTSSIYADSGSISTGPLSLSTTYSIEATDGTVTTSSTSVHVTVIPFTPVASPLPDTYTSAQDITLSSPGATIRYQFGSTAPTCSSGSLYSSPITATSTMTISAIACGPSGEISSPATFAYTINIPILPPSPVVATPSDSVIYSSTQNVNLTSASATSIRYNIGSTAPTCSTGTLFVSGVPIVVSSSEMITAIGCNDGGASTPVTFNYTIHIPVLCSDPLAINNGDTTQSCIYNTVMCNDSSAINNGDTTHACIYDTIHSSTTCDNPLASNYMTPQACIFPVRCGDHSASNYNAIGQCIYNTICSGSSCTNATSTEVSTATSTLVLTATSTETVLPPAVTAVINSVNIARDAVSSVVNSDTGVIVTRTAGAVGAVAGSTLTVASGLFLSPLSFADILLIPIRLWSLLLGAVGLAKRKKPWGTVYDSVTKQPLDPVYVILRNSVGKDIATAITDLDGRYGFVIPEAGAYTLIAHKTNYQFPSQKLVGQSQDELYSDLYFGEHFTVKAAGDVVIKNIPLDPEKFDWNEFAKRQQHLMNFYSKREKWLLRFSNYFFYIGFSVAAVTEFASTTKYNTIIFALYVVLLVVRRFGVKAKPYGHVVSKETSEPIPFAIVRVSQAGTGVEVIHKVTDAIGRFYCLLPNGEYTIRVDRKLLDGKYETIADKVPASVTKGYLSETFSLDAKPEKIF